MEIKKCMYCGSEFEGRKNKLYCSEKCKMAAFNKGNKTDKPVISTHKPLMDTTEKRLTFLSNNSVEKLVPITVMMTQKEKESLEAQAQSCCVGLSNYIRIRSQMDETDVAGMEETIERLKKENNDMRIKLSFYKQGHNPTIKNEDGIYLKMNKKQKKFLIEKFLETQDTYMLEDVYKLPDGTMTSSHLEYFEMHEKHEPGFIEDRLKYDILDDFLYGVQNLLTEEFGYEDTDFEETPLANMFYNLGKE